MIAFVLEPVFLAPLTCSSVYGPCPAGYPLFNSANTSSSEPVVLISFVLLFLAAVISSLAFISANTSSSEPVVFISLFSCVGLFNPNASEKLSINPSNIPFLSEFSSFFGSSDLSFNPKVSRTLSNIPFLSEFSSFFGSSGMLFSKFSSLFSLETNI